MDTLKRILTVMVVILIVILVGGGFYLASMGGMQHGSSMDTTSNQSKNETGQPNKVATNNNQSMQMNPNSPGTNQETQTGPVDSKDRQALNNQENSKMGPSRNDQSNLPATGPVIVQVPVQTQKTDPRIYIEQLKERLKAINEANSSIASNSGGHTMVVQPNGSVDSSGQGNMNELHQEFYKLGQNVESMQESLNNLSSEINVSQSSTQPGTINNYPYGYSQNVSPGYYLYPYNPYQNYAGQTLPGQANPQQNQSGQNQTNNSQTNDNSGSMNNMNGISNMNGSQMNHNTSISGMLNANTLKLVFSLVLIGSIVLGIIAIVGFIGSLFKTKEVPQTEVSNHSI